MEIRKIVLDDLSRVFELLNELYQGCLEYKRFEEVYKIKLTDSNSYYVVAIIDGKIVGILTSELQVKLHRVKKQIFIEDLIVDSAYRSKGIGKALIENAVEFAKENDCEIMELTCYINNEDGHRFYENNNFIKQAYKFKRYLNK